MTLQAGLIAVVAILGIGSASVVIERVLVRSALSSETEHFWRNYQLDSSFATPNTANMKGYLTDADSEQGMPEELLGYGLGYHKIHGQMAYSLLYTSESAGKRLHLLFDGKSVLRLAIYFGLFPLSIVLILIYLTAWWVYRESNNMLSPIVWLANKFDRFDPAHPDSRLEDMDEIPGDADWEVEKLVTSFRSYSKRIKQLVERERAFTRDASHEFRTPLTVIKMASDLLLAEPELDPFVQKYGVRIKGAAQDMEELIDAFLVLARETDNEFEDEPVVIADVLAREVKDAQIYLDEKPIQVNIVNDYPLQLLSAHKVVSIVLGNLIRNAVLYTEKGTITITVGRGSVKVADTGVGMTQDQIKRIFRPYYRAEQNKDSPRKGYGIGLTIVKRLSSRFDWLVEVESEVGVGTCFTVVFDQAAHQVST